MTAKKYGYAAAPTSAQAGRPATVAPASKVTAYQGWTGVAASSAAPRRAAKAIGGSGRRRTTQAATPASRAIARGAEPAKRYRPALS